MCGSNRVICHGLRLVRVFGDGLRMADDGGCRADALAAKQRVVRCRHVNRRNSGVSWRIILPLPL